MIFQLFLHLLNVQLWNDMNSEKKLIVVNDIPSSHTLIITPFFSGSCCLSLVLGSLGWLSNKHLYLLKYVLLGGSREEDLVKLKTKVLSGCWLQELRNTYTCASDMSLVVNVTHHMIHIIHPPWWPLTQTEWPTAGPSGWPPLPLVREKEQPSFNQSTHLSISKSIRRSILNSSKS